MHLKIPQTLGSGLSSSEMQRMVYNNSPEIACVSQIWPKRDSEYMGPVDSINGRVGDEELNEELTPCKLRRSVQMIFYQSRFWFSTDPILRLRSSAKNK